MDTSELRQTAPGSNPRGVSPEGIMRLTRAAGHDGSPVTSSTLPIADHLRLRELKLKARGIVLGSAISHVEIPYGGYFQNQELVSMSHALHHARTVALARMCEEAKRLEADGVIGIGLSVLRADWASDTLEIRVSGTAVVSTDPQAPVPIDSMPFTCGLSVGELLDLARLYLRPVSIVFGNCVYHIGYQGLLQALRQFGVNTELQSYTQALSGARELAICRMEDDARTLTSHEIVGVQLVESTHAWRSHVFEYFAIGTAVAPIAIDRFSSKERLHVAKPLSDGTNSSDQVQGLK